MRRLYGEARRAQAFADALDRGTVDGGDQRLKRETAHLLSMAEAICRAELEDPRPEFALELRERLMQEAPQALAVQPRRAQRVVHVKPITTPEAAPHRYRRRLGAAAAAFAVAGGSFGLVSTSAQALPGDMLYPVKRGVERVELGLSQGQVAVGRTRLTQANERLWEVQRLVGQGEVDAREAALINDALAAFSSGAGSGASSMLAAYADRGNEGAVTQVNEFASSSGEVLTKMSPGLPAANDEAYKSAAKTVNRLAVDARAACAVCATTSVSPIPTRLQPGVNDVTSPSGQAPDTGSQDDTTGGDDAPKGSAPDPTTRTPAPTRAPVVPDKTVAPQLPDTGSDAGDKAGDEADEPPPLKVPIKKVTDPLLKGLMGDGTGSSEPLVPGLDDPLGN